MGLQMHLLGFLGGSSSGFSLVDLLKLVAVAVIVWLVMKMLAKPQPPVAGADVPATESVFSEFQKKVAKLLVFIDSLGLPLLKPLLLDLSQGRFVAIPGHVSRLFDSIDDKLQRSQLLDGFFYSPAGLDRQLADPELQKKLLGTIETKLGIVIPRKA